MEFYLFFFDILGLELVSTIEETRVSDIILEYLNTTYLILIPKVDRPLSFGDYRPIALCNLLYKLITKIIAGRMKEIWGSSSRPSNLVFFRADKSWMRLV